VAGRSRGDTVRSDADFDQVLKELQAQELRNKLGEKNKATLPRMLTEEEKRFYAFRNTNGLIEDVREYNRRERRANPWTEEEKDIFLRKYARYPNNFLKISAFLPRKSVNDCIAHYFASKGKFDAHILLKASRRKKQYRNSYGYGDDQAEDDDEDYEEKRGRKRGRQRGVGRHHTRIGRGGPYWTDIEKQRFVEAIDECGKDFIAIAERVGTKGVDKCRNYFNNNKRKLNLEERVRKANLLLGKPNPKPRGRGVRSSSSSKPALRRNAKRAVVRAREQLGNNAAANLSHNPPPRQLSSNSSANNATMHATLIPNTNIPTAKIAPNPKIQASNVRALPTMQIVSATAIPVQVGQQQRGVQHVDGHYQVMGMGVHPRRKQVKGGTEDSMNVSMAASQTLSEMHRHGMERAREIGGEGPRDRGLMNIEMGVLLEPESRVPIEMGVPVYHSARVSNSRGHQQQWIQQGIQEHLNSQYISGQPGASANRLPGTEYMREHVQYHYPSMRHYPQSHTDSSIVMSRAGNPPPGAPILMKEETSMVNHPSANKVASIGVQKPAAEYQHQPKPLPHHQQGGGNSEMKS